MSLGFFETDSIEVRARRKLESTQIGPFKINDVMLVFLRSRLSIERSPKNPIDELLASYSVHFRSAFK